MADQRVLLVDLADELQIRKQRLFKLLPKLGIRTSLHRESARLGRTVASVTAAEAARLRHAVAHARERRPASPPIDSSGVLPQVAADEVGVFYVVQLEPDYDKGRFKVGFTAELEGRLRKHRTSAPFARCEKSWPCRRVWERAAIDCATEGCEQLHTEVFRTDSMAEVIHRADGFFHMMPKLHKQAQQG